MEITASYNVYCDESRFSNPFSQYFLIGAIYLPRNQQPQLKSKIKSVRRQFGFMPELKWQNVTAAKLPYLRSLVDVFFESELQFRTIIVDKSKLHLEKSGVVDDLPFYKFYYLLLKGIFIAQSEYFVFVDERKRQESYAKLIDYLQLYLDKINQQPNPKYLRSFQEVKSEQVLFMQLADLFMGAVGYYWNGFRGSNAKLKFIDYVTEKLPHTDLKFKSQLHDHKWNQFVWQPATK